jgi:hypothetical protein
MNGTQRKQEGEKDKDESRCTAGGVFASKPLRDAQASLLQRQRSLFNQPLHAFSVFSKTDNAAQVKGGVVACEPDSYWPQVA